MVVSDPQTLGAKNRALLEGLVATATGFAQQSRSANTTKAYASDWSHFAAWADAANRDTLPASPGTVALYLTAYSDSLKVTTLSRRLTAIRQAHAVAGKPFNAAAPELREVWKGIVRTKGRASNPVAPAVLQDLIAMLAGLPDSLTGIRDRALLLTGFAGGFRRSELTGLEMEDLIFTNDGLVVSLRHSKTDQEGEGSKVGVPYGQHDRTCPVLALQRWLVESGITDEHGLNGSGKVFRSVTRHSSIGESLSTKAVSLIVKRAAEGAGLDPSKYAGHSLRSGFATSAAAAGASERAIMKQGRWRSLPVARRYIRDGSLFLENAAASIGL